MGTPGTFGSRDIKGPGTRGSDGFGTGPDSRRGPGCSGGGSSRTNGSSRRTTTGRRPAFGAPSIWSEPKPWFGVRCCCCWAGPTNTAGTGYQFVEADEWPNWGSGSGYTHDLRIGTILGADAQVDGAGGSCYQGHAYHGTTGEICGTRYDGLDGDWGAAEVEVWRPR